MGNILSLFTGGPERSPIISDPDVVHTVSFKRFPAVMGIVPNLEIAAAANPGIDESSNAAHIITPRLDVLLADLDRREQFREAVTGTNILAPALEGDTSQADWDERLSLMQREKDEDDNVVDLDERRRMQQIEESRRVINQEAASHEHRSAA